MRMQKEICRFSHNLLEGYALFIWHDKYLKEKTVADFENYTFIP